MKMNVKQIENAKHEEMVNGVTWISGNEVYSISDDKKIFKWDSNNLTQSEFIEVAEYPTFIDYFGSGKGNQDIFAVGYMNGSIQFINKAGKIEKTVNQAHGKNVSIICLRWSTDGSLVSAGEDGSIKVWSKSGNPRTTIQQPNDKTIYSICWSAESDSIIYASDKSITLKPIQQQSQKENSWKAHDGVVLQIDWNPNNNNIVSCGEDCRYKVWDSYGRLIYASQAFDYVLTSIKWSPNGQYFAVGAFNMLRLCDQTGWTYSFHKHQNGSIMSLDWTSDGTIVSGGCGNGKVVFGYVVEKSVSFENIEILQLDDHNLQQTDLITNEVKNFEYTGRIIDFQIGYDHLVVSTTNQCHLYSFSN